MKLVFPSREFDEAVASVCHGSASDEQARALNELLRSHHAARDEYILRLELHSRLASEPDLFASREQSFWTEVAERSGDTAFDSDRPFAERRGLVHESGRSKKSGAWAIALAACLALFAAGWWGFKLSHPSDRKGAISKAIAMLDRTVDAQWQAGQAAPKAGAPIEPGWLRLKSGLAQIVFYSGARVVIEGPAELQIISPGEASCPAGRLVAEVPPQARGFRVNTPQMNVTDLGTLFGVEVKDARTELHVFKGSVEFQPESGATNQHLNEGAGAVAERARPLRFMPANPDAFASLFELQTKSSFAETLHYEQWSAASRRLNDDPSLLVRFDFENVEPPDWTLRNTAERSRSVPDATIVGCQRAEGRWREKKALEFQGVSDRVRLSVPGEFESLTLAAWVRVQGLDRQINSLFMSDGFEAGTVHWSIRRDGVLALTAIGSEPGRFQICHSPPVLAVDQFGQWLHLAVVIDGGTKQVAHYVNGVPVSEEPLTIKPPFRIGVAELGNWNAQGFPRNDPFMIRNFSGAMDEFCLFSRALDAGEIRALHSQGRPQPDPVAAR